MRIGMLSPCGLEKAGVTREFSKQTLLKSDGAMKSFRVLTLVKLN